MTVRRCSNCSVVAKISTWCRPWRRRRMKAPWSWRRSSSVGSAPSWSIASVQPRATRARKSASFSGGRARQGVLHPGQGLGVAGVPDLLQCEGDDCGGPGRDLARGDGGAEFLVHGRHRLPGESPAGQQTLGQGEPAPCLRRTDQQPRPQELRRVPVPVIHRSLRRTGRSTLPVGPASRVTPGRRSRRPAANAGAEPGASSCQPVVHEVPALPASAADCFLARSTAPGRDNLQILHRAGELLHAPGEVRRRLQSP